MEPTPAFDPNSPLFPPLASYMKVDLITNSDGAIWIVHEKPLPDILKWADYDVDAATITLAHESGKIQELGVKVPKTMTTTLHDATQISVILMQEQNVLDFTMVPLNTIAASES